MVYKVLTDFKIKERFPYIYYMTINQTAELNLVTIFTSFSLYSFHCIALYFPMISITCLPLQDLPSVNSLSPGIINYPLPQEI